MPHIIVKLWPGKAEKQKQELAERITLAVTEVLNYSSDSVSVALEEISSEDWAKKVYGPEIVNGPGQLYKKPGYRM
ncbi:MAG: tautomerase family protein [Bryobacteraceae bacterium]